MRKTYLLVFLLLLSLDCFSQTPEFRDSPATASTAPGDNKTAKKECSLEYSKMPLFKNVKIGINYDEVKMSFPEIEHNEWFQKDYRVNKGGLFMISAKNISNVEIKTDLRQLSLNFENDEVRIYNFIFKSSKWKSLEDMIDDLSQIYNVDEDYWSIYNSESVEMKCKDFTVYASHLKNGNKINNSLAVHKK